MRILKMIADFFVDRVDRIVAFFKKLYKIARPEESHINETTIIVGEEPKKCNHSMLISSAEYDKKYGRRCKCMDCGKVVLFSRPARLKHGKIHMSKKERIRLRRES